MTSQFIIIMYFIVFSVQILLENTLQYLNLNFARKNGGKIPDFMIGIYSEEEYGKSVSYTTEKGILSIIRSLFYFIAVTSIILSGILGIVDIALSGLLGNGIPMKILYVLMTGLLFYLIGLPFNLYGQFVTEKKYGFSTITPGVWIADQIKLLIMSAVIGSLLLTGVFVFMSSAGPLWWIYAYISYAFIQIIIIFLYPVLIAPLFNKYTPMNQGPLKDRLISLTDRLQFPVKGLFVMDGSKRSKHSNAQFTGFGRNKRIILFDTLLDQLNADELESVLAHEIGHYKKRHIIFSLVFSLFIILCGFLAIDFFRDFDPLYRAFGIPVSSDHTLIVILIFFSSPFTFLLTPLLSVLSRHFEYQADGFAAGSLVTGNSLISALRKLAAKNLSNLMPHKAFSFFYYTHPSLRERILRLQKAEQT